MTVVDAYCQPEDLLLGDVPTSSESASGKYCVDAADEIDSRIGHIYQTRVVIVDPAPPGTPSPVSRPARLLLKRINVWLATGRLLMAQDASGEESSVHAYALKLVTDASAAIDMIAYGQIVLDGAPKVSGYSEVSSGPIYANLDSESSVEAFYNRIANPYYVFPAEVEPWYGRPYYPPVG